MSPTDAQSRVVEPLLPAPGNTRGKGGPPERHPCRLVLDAIFYLVVGGIASAALPHDFLPAKTVYGLYSLCVNTRPGSPSTAPCATWSAYTRAATPPRPLRSSAPRAFAAPTCHGASPAPATGDRVPSRTLGDGGGRHRPECGCRRARPR
ncbi:transposase [Pseudonocardia petroleophila]|uniref:Transposase n=1 Tax=Pseudonocardia petroleophila TaxID=37331 RepID=A0A7G7MBT1_9PSEU|nr:transposase [Pseudonocardia petroleophila]